MKPARNASAWYVLQPVAQNLSTTSLQDDAYAFIFDQKGLMAGISIEGTKINKLQ